MVIELDVTEKIRNCPYCGSKPQRLYGVENGRYWIWCNNSECDVQPATSLYKNEGADIKYWNRLAKLAGQILHNGQ